MSLSKKRMKVVVVYKKPGALLKSAIILKRPRGWLYTCLYSANITIGLRIHLKYTETTLLLYYEII